MINLIVLFSLFGFAFAQESVDLSNDREGETFYSSRGDKRAVARALKSIDGSVIESVYDEALMEFTPGTLCAPEMVKSLQEKFKNVSPKFNELEGAILHLRTQNKFDDTVARILLFNGETLNTKLHLPKQRKDLFYPSQKTVDDALKVISDFEKRSKKLCFDEAYRNLFGDILKFNKTLKSYHVEAIFVEAFKQKKISYETYYRLEQARVNELENFSLTLKTHFRKIRSLRNQFPLRDPEERSQFVTQKADNFKISRRQKLFEQYTDLQIMLMANVIKKLRTRLEAPKAEILIYDRSNGVETIPLDPMERFRLAIKLLRKEMTLLSTNTYFAGRSPEYMDLMVAAYETGIIPASELQEISGLQDIWNPKKTFWEKAQVWVRTFSSVATIALPPPYGFIPALAVVVIEMTAGKKNNINNDPTVLF
jgi:hypothetical protein